MIKPTVGRMVWYWPSHYDIHERGRRVLNSDQPFHAMVVYVWHDRMVNLSVFDHNGAFTNCTSVPLLQDDDQIPSGIGYAEWMPYQKGQAAKTEEAEKARDTSSGVAGLGMLGALGLALLAAVIAWPSSAKAADQSPPAARKVAASNPFQYPTTGWYFGIGTEGGGGSANVSAPNVNAASLTTTSIDVHGLVGYVWGVPNSPMFMAAEARAGWTNFNGQTAGFSFSGPVGFEERFIVGAPVNQLMALFPSIFGGVTPPPFTPPVGQVITASNWYIGPTFDQRDISLNFGLTSNRVYALAPGVTIGVKNLLSGGTAIDTYAKVRFDDKGVCVGAVPAGGCGSLGTSFLAGINLNWGI